MTDFETELAARIVSAESRTARLETLETRGGGDFVHIQTQTTTENTSDLTFTGIPAIYKHLFIIYSIAGYGGLPEDTLEVQINDDVANNYLWLLRRWQPLAMATVSLSGQDSMLLGAEGTTALEFSAGYILIPDYLNTAKYKSTRAGVFSDFLGTLRTAIYGGNWETTAAIASLKFFLSLGRMRANSKISLYGIR